MISLTSKNRRLLAILILLVVIAALLSVAVLPVVVASRNFTNSIEELQFQLRNYQRTAAQEVSLKTRLTQLDSAQISDDDLLIGESTAIAGANLQELFKQRVKQAGGNLESTQILDESYSGNLQRIGIRAQFSGTIEALQRTLYHIEFGKPLLFVNNIEINARRSPRRVQRGLSTAATGTLRVAMDVSGFRRNEGGQ